MSGANPGILLVDDVEANLVALEAQLGDLGCDLVRASSGNQALRELLKREFAVLLLDVQMPEMDGYEVARFARDNRATREVPIIFVTAMHENESNMLRGYGAGAVDVLFKPINPHILHSKVRVFLELYLGKQKLAKEVRAHEKTSAELKASNEQLAHASRVKTDFLSMMSHELRTPLNAINGFSELLLDQQCGPLNERQLRSVQNIHNGGKHLLTLINDLLDLSKIEAGKLEVELHPLSPRAIAEEAMTTFAELANTQRVTLSVEPAGPTPLPAVAADPVRMRQVLYNLLSNALKFTPSGGSVVISFLVMPDQGTVRTTVTDTGPGIEAHELELLFQPFSQLKNAKQAPRNGTGLGLSLSRQLVGLMGGEVGVESTPGVGSRFFVDIPIHPSRLRPGAEG